MYTFLPYAYLEGKFLPFKDANISIATHALHYGTGAFGGLRAIPNPENERQILLFRLDNHAKRLSNSAKLLHWNISPEEIRDKIIEFIKINKPQVSSYLRPLIYTSDLGVSPRLHEIEKNFLIYGLELGDYLPVEGIKCRFSSWYRQEDRSLPLRGKITGAYITSSLAKTEAVESGFDEAIMFNSRGKVSEASGMNIFIVRDGKLITPDVTQDILEGITRDSVITIAKDMGIEVIEREVDRSEILIADEVFFTGTAAKVTPVNQVESTMLPKNRPITEKLKQKITEIVENRSTDYKDWVTVVEI